MREGSFEGFSVVGVCGYLQIIHDADARKLEVAALLFTGQLVGSFWSSAWRSSHSCFGFHLRLNVFAFPTACHGSSVTHMA